jgi:hypothetical protein
MQVFKTTKDGKVLETFGHAWQPGADKHSFCKPTDVAVLSDGTAFVSDGYCNSRLLTLPRHRAPGDAMVATQLGLPHKTSAGMLQHTVAANGCRRQVEVGNREVGAIHRLQLAEGGMRVRDGGGEEAEEQAAAGLEFRSKSVYRLDEERRAFGKHVRCCKPPFCNC